MSVKSNPLQKITGIRIHDAAFDLLVDNVHKYNKP